MDKKSKIVGLISKKIKEFLMKTAQLKILSNLHHNWERDPILALMDTVLSKNQELYNIVKKDYLQVRKDNGIGRQDSPSLEQVVRGALYMNLKNVDYDKFESGNCLMTRRFVKHF